MSKYVVLPWVIERRRPSGAAGFTLIEVMIVVAIVAILAAIAIPSYARYGFRARRADGQELVMRIANAQERFYTVNNAYTSVAANLPSLTSEKSFYLAAIVVPAGGQSYTITVTPQGAQTADECGPLTYTNTGVKGIVPGGNASNGACW